LEASFRRAHLRHEFEYNSDGEIARIKQVTAGYGKSPSSTVLEKLRTGPDASSM